MPKFSRFPLTVLAALALISLVACKPGDKAADAGDASKPGASAGADAKDKDGIAIDGVKGLPTERDQISYMVGMGVGKQLEPVKDRVDPDVLAKALKDAWGDGKMLLTEEQAQQIGQAFGRQLQAEELEKRTADARKNSEEGKRFLAENGKKQDVVTTKSGLEYKVLAEGKGPKPGPQDMVKVNYKGALLDGTVFDDTANHGGSAQLPVSQVVPGWQEGMQLMPVGSKYRFWIPADLAYGEQGTPGGPIPPNATLVFDVELLDIVKAPSK